MFQESEENRSLKEYRELEMALHFDLMGVCRKYLTKLGIVSIIGIFDLVKQEAMELERATREDIKDEEEKARKREEERMAELEKAEEQKDEKTGDNFFSVE